MYRVFLIENLFYMCSNCKILRPNLSKRLQWDVQVSDHPFSRSAEVLCKMNYFHRSSVGPFESRRAVGFPWIWSLEQVSHNDFTYCKGGKKRCLDNLCIRYTNTYYNEWSTCHCPSTLNPSEGSVVYLKTISISLQV